LVFAGPALALWIIALSAVSLRIIALLCITLLIIALDVLTGRIAFIAAALAIETGEIGVHAVFHRLVFGLAFAPPIAAGFTSRAGALIIRAHTAVGDHPKVMIGKLQIVFRLNPITIQVRVLRLFAIFFEHLRRIAPCTAIDPVKLLPSASALRTIVGPTATAVVIVVPTIVIQVRHILVCGGPSGMSDNTV
jgi:multisubunit Na+/H+ antiporter MnhF subunit